MNVLALADFKKNIDKSSLSRWRSHVSRINQLGSDIRALQDDELRKKSLSLRYEALSGKPLDKLMPEAFALVRDASRRILGKSHYDVQLLGGIAMHFDSIAVMQTGEGKTLAATLPLYVAALTGQGAHLATANDYLAARDAELTRPIFAALGMTVGVVCSDTSRSDRQASYRCDVTYSTAKEIGFDFLRDRLCQRRIDTMGMDLIASLIGSNGIDQASQPVQRELNFVLVDEADSILIDEARTPLVVSSMPDEAAQAKIGLYRWAKSNCESFQIDVHYELNEKTRQVSLKSDGRRLVRKLPQHPLLGQIPTLDIYEQVEQALFVNENYIRDRHYMIRDGEVVIVDEFTGRLAEGRKWRSGVHQAIEAREDLEISVETGEAARITIQDLFLKYRRLCGMTGTAANSAKELRKIYEVRVVEIPTNHPPNREQWGDMVFGSEAQKWQAIADEICSLSQTGRPVLVGTRSIDKSELLAGILNERGVAHEVLNARQLANEAEIVMGAGQVGRVTVATNMAGRGTDIKISEQALKLGGLHVICTELHDAARIDRQLVGRCGRQGDPGSFRQFMSLEDDILKTGLGEHAAIRLLRHQAQSTKSLARYSALFRAAQTKIERRHFKARKMLLHHEKTRQEMQHEMGQDPYLDTAGA